MTFAEDTPDGVPLTVDPLFVLDVSQENESVEVSIYNEVMLAQSFVPTMTPLTKVDVRINKPKKVETPLRLSIRSSLDGSDLTYQMITAEDVPFFVHWLSFDITDIDVQIGRTYYIVLQSMTSVTNSYRWQSIYTEDDDHYTDGCLYRYFIDSQVWETVQTETDFVDACFRTYSYQPEVDLVCSGYLNWTNITPAQEGITGFFTVSNEGTPFSRLHWEIENWPGWGTWEFSVMEQDGLTPEASPRVVEITIEAPHINVPDEYLGRIVIVNVDDPEDKEEVYARMVTAKQKKEVSGLDDMIFGGNGLWSRFWWCNGEILEFLQSFIGKYKY